MSISCPNCDHLSPKGTKFCSECGTRLLLICKECNAELSPKAKFCSECGAAQAQAPAPQKLDEPPRLRSGAEPERRQITMMFCDLVASTSMAERNDPEDMRELLQSYHEAATPAIHEYGGHIAQMQGDGLVIYFGYPKAHEDDARRAILSGLDILRCVKDKNSKLQDQDNFQLRVRIGIHTGEVLVDEIGDGKHIEILAIGETPNITARVQSLANINEIFISETTAKLVQGEFDWEELKPARIRGLSRRIPLYRIISSSKEPSQQLSSSLFVGRSGELGLIKARWQEVLEGCGRLITIHGEPGIGKTRLIREFQNQINREEVNWLECRSSPYYINSSLKIIEDLFTGLCGASLDLENETQSLEYLTEALNNVSLYSSYNLALLAPLFAIESLPNDVPPLQLLPQVRKSEALKVLETWILKLSSKKPIVIFIEDAHWLDQSSLEFFGQLFQSSSDSACLSLLTHRKEFTPPWEGQSTISLSRLPTDEVKKLALSLDAKGVQSDIINQVIEKGDGNPLFVEELVKMVNENPSGSDFDIPDSLQGSLVARIDQLSPLKRIIQASSLIGRTFTMDTLSKVLEIPEERLKNELDKCVQAEILHFREPKTYSFKHALLRNAARETMTRKSRISYHKRIVRILETENNPPLPEVMAHHYAEAEFYAQAIEFGCKAGERALMSNGLFESISHLKLALSWCQYINEPQQKTICELQVYCLLGVPLMLTKGFAAPEVAEHYQNQLDLCRKLDYIDKKLLFPALWGLWTYHEVSAQLPKALAMGERLLVLAKRDNDSSIHLASATACGAAHLLMGQLEKAESEFLRGLEVYNMKEHAPLAFLFGQDAGAMCSSFLTWLHALKGDKHKVNHYIEKSLKMSNTLNQPTTEGFVLTVVAIAQCLIEEYENAQQTIQKVIELATRLGFPHWLSQGTATLGWALTGKGQYEIGLEKLIEGTTGMRMLGTKAGMSFFDTKIANAYLNLNQDEKALETIRRIINESNESGERFYLPEVYRIHHLLLSRKGDETSTIASTKALDESQRLAKNMGFKSAK